jgi:hypothetical protein
MSEQTEYEAFTEGAEIAIQAAHWFTHATGMPICEINTSKRLAAVMALYPDCDDDYSLGIEDIEILQAAGFHIVIVDDVPRPTLEEMCGMSIEDVER